MKYLMSGCILISLSCLAGCDAQSGLHGTYICNGIKGAVYEFSEDGTGYSTSKGENYKNSFDYQIDGDVVLVHDGDHTERFERDGDTLVGSPNVIGICSLM